MLFFTVLSVMEKRTILFGIGGTGSRGAFLATSRRWGRTLLAEQRDLLCNFGTEDELL